MVAAQRAGEGCRRQPSQGAVRAVMVIVFAPTLKLLSSVLDREEDFGIETSEVK